MRNFLPTVALTLVLTACTHIDDPEIRVPTDFSGAETTTLEISGINGWRKGTFTADGYRGAADWTASRTGLLGGLRTFRSTVFATVEAEGLPELSARCVADEAVIAGELKGVDVAIPLKEVGLHCSFAEAGNAIEGTLLLRKDEGRGPLGAAAFGRDGLVRFGAKTWKIDSIHHLATARVGVPGPIGYSLTRGDETLAVIDQTERKPEVQMLDSLTDVERQRVMLTAVILSTYVDPTEF
ncbi:hypothetical protein [Parvularcula lutaonensis]|uniref:Uncharacterized protein n=1 Tax=Parvularcula lutaonensis TaxID=491923 RepID=A0ABV7M943_9PROT|nr:hypothetical protein [Parvularcula lutaonensis]GGY41386.1 hypothetical protein GCM10007148_07470 [Parvularcula lutaonensis]